MKPDVISVFQNHIQVDFVLTKVPFDVKHVLDRLCASHTDPKRPLDLKKELDSECKDSAYSIRKNCSLGANAEKVS